MLGQTISHYDVVEKIGEGGMGVVYMAEDTRLHRRVALKFLRPDALGGPELKARFLTEAEAAAALTHPNVCMVHDIDEVDGQPFIAMEYIEGESLAEKTEKRPLPLDDALDIAIQVAEGLQAAHEKGIVHRDIKPANVMIDAKGRAKITDFGLAHLEEGTRITKPGTSIGTPAYMSPEQIRGDKVDHRSDIWSLGVTLYEMLTGQPPFRGEVREAVSHSILYDEPEPLTAVRTRVPIPVEKSVEKALRKNPAQRYQHLDDLLVDLRALRGADRHADSKTASHRRFVVATAAVLLMIASGAYFTSQETAPQNSLLSVRPLTSLVGEEGWPTWSPDGSMMAYSYSGTGSWDIFVMPTRGGEPVRIVDSPADEILARWSPDGQYIAFASDRGEGAAIYLIPPLGGREQKLAEANVSQLMWPMAALRIIGMAPWSPDGKELLFSRQGSERRFALWKVNIETHEETQLTDPPAGVQHLEASWSFDGDRIVFSHYEGAARRFVLMPADGGEQTTLLEGYARAAMPVWTSDNRRVVFVSARAGPLNLWEIDIESRRVRQLTAGAGDDFLPSIARDGRLAYATFSHQTDIYALETESGVEKRLTAHVGENFAPRPSPDGKRIVYDSTRTGNHDIWLIDLDTGSEQQLTTHEQYDMLPDWSPDGKEILFVSNRGGSFQLWVMNLEGGAPRCITDQPIYVAALVSYCSVDGAPWWSPDGGSIGYLAHGEESVDLWTVDPDGTNAKLRLKDARRFQWYRSSRHVIYTPGDTHKSGQLEIRAADLETGEEVTLHTEPHVEIAVTDDGAALSFAEAQSHSNRNIYRMRLQTPTEPRQLPRPLGEPEKLTAGGGLWHAHNGDWSPDGKTLYYTRDFDSGDIYVVDNFR